MIHWPFAGCFLLKHKRRMNSAKCNPLFHVVATCNGSVLIGLQCNELLHNGVSNTVLLLLGHRETVSYRGHHQSSALGRCCTLLQHFLQFPTHWRCATDPLLVFSFVGVRWRPTLVATSGTFTTLSSSSPSTSFAAFIDALYKAFHPLRVLHPNCCQSTLWKAGHKNHVLSTQHHLKPSCRQARKQPLSLQELSCWHGCPTSWFSKFLLDQESHVKVSCECQSCVQHCGRWRWHGVCEIQSSPLLLPPSHQGLVANTLDWQVLEWCYCMQQCGIVCFGQPSWLPSHQPNFWFLSFTTRPVCLEPKWKLHC